LRKALWPARLAQKLGLMTAAEKLGLFRLLPTRLRQMALTLPPLPKTKEPPLPEVLPAIGRRRARVALFTGCVGDVMFNATNWATARVLQHNGCDVIVPRGQVCCGAINFHAADSATAKQMANTNANVFQPDEVDAVIVNVAGCGAMLKEYGHHWHDKESHAREKFSRKVRDIHEFLDQLGPIAPTGRIEGKATYHDACHLVHAQKIRTAPRKLLGMIPGLEWSELAESEVCCGAAGTYNLTQPEMSAILSRRKLDNIIATGANMVVTANAGCLLQIMREARVRGIKLKIVHPMDLLDASYRG
jgi:glycolate oxidase iron-sulfur subunit